MNNQKEGLAALERLMANYYEMCQDLGNNDDQYQRCNLTSERAIIEQALKEHEQHKAIENDLGIDLVILFKAITNGVWVKTKNGISKHLTVALKKRHHTKEYWLFYRPYSHVYLKDYGKTWALTKEELEK